MAEKLGPEALAFDARMWSNGHRADEYRNLGWVSNENLLAAVVDGAGLNHMPIKLALETACYLHDIGRSVKDKGHNQEGVKLATPFLEKIGVSKREIGAVTHAVECHAKELILSARTIEAKLLFDADKLEILSVYGFMRVWMFLVEERKMELDKALDFLWDWAVEVRKRYLQTIYAKRIVDPELAVLALMVDRFRAWNTSRKHKSINA